MRKAKLWLVLHGIGLDNIIEACRNCKHYPSGQEMIMLYEGQPVDCKMFTTCFRLHTDREFLKVYNKNEFTHNLLCIEWVKHIS